VCFACSKSVQDASRENSHHAYAKFVESAWESSRFCTLRGQMELVKLTTPINIDEVEPAANIVKRFCTGKYAFNSFVLVNNKVIILQSDSFYLNIFISGECYNE
jgi:glutamate synthase domain-containing protein 2